LTLSGDYGETLVSPDDLAAFTPAVRRYLGEQPTKAEVYDLEQEIERQTETELVLAVLEGTLTVDELLSDVFVRDLHARLYAEIWQWGGRFRVRELNIGVPPESIVTELHMSLGNLAYRWENTRDWSARQLGMAVHAETVRVHPFVDGNGRSTRLLGQLVFVAAQPGPGVEVFDWEVDKESYVGALRRYDVSRDPSELAVLVDVQPVTDP
jgi:fido (protein-threonine AMPylation protein)